MKYELDKECALKVELSIEECTEELKKEIAELKKMLTTKNEVATKGMVTIINFTAW